MKGNKKQFALGGLQNINMEKSYFKYIFALLLFGSNGIVASHISLNSYEIVFFRTLVGSIFLLLLFIASKQKSRILQNKKQMGYMAISGAAMGASWMFLYEAYTQIGVSIGTLVYYCGPVIVMIVAPIVFHEKISGVKAAGFLTVLLGMFLVNSQALLRGEFSWGLLCGLLSAVMYAFMVIFNKKVSDITGLENSVCQLMMSFLAVGIFTVLKQGCSFSIPQQSILPILLLGIVNTGIGCYLYFSSIPRLPAQSVAICGYLEPVSALLFSAALLGERLTLIQFVGTALVLGGTAFGEFFHRKRSAA